MSKVLDVFTRNQENMCNLRHSPSQFLMDLYTLTALTEVKGYMTVQFSYIVFKMYGHDSLVMESDLSRRKFDTNTAYKISFAKEIIAQSATKFWRCDSRNPKEGSDFIRLIKLLQGHLENEVDMNDRRSCRDNCGTYKVAEPKGCFKDMFCAKQRKCEGRLFDCQFFHADAWVCMSQNQERNYDWIEYENGIQLGQQDRCISKYRIFPRLMRPRAIKLEGNQNKNCFEINFYNRLKSCALFSHLFRTDKSAGNFDLLLKLPKRQ